MLHRDVVRAFRIEREREFIGDFHFRRAIEVQTIIERPFGDIEGQRIARSSLRMAAKERRDRKEGDDKRAIHGRGINPGE